MNAITCRLTVGDNEAVVTVPSGTQVYRALSKPGARRIRLADGATYERIEDDPSDD